MREIYITYKTETDGSLEQYTNKGTIQALINDSAAVHTTTGYTPKYGGGGSGTGETSTSSESTTESRKVQQVAQVVKVRPQAVRVQ
ncbi:hypothetical protein OM428_17585 [Enterococcus gallinarum]|nr:hypothetical protein [Enterococcus gallinarum]